MDPASTASTVALVLAVIGGLGGAYAALRQRNTEDVGQVLTAQSTHMATLSAENGDLRTRMTNAEEQIRRLREEVWNCERDKDRLKLQILALEGKVDGDGI